jgi:hypothetical protein
VAVPLEPEPPPVLEETPPATDESPEAEPEPEPTEEPAPEEGASEEDASQRRRGRFDRRFSDLTKERNEALLAQARAEGRAEAEREHNEYLRQQLAGAPAPQAPPVPQDGLRRDEQGRVQRPREAEYATASDYEQAMDVYESARDAERTALILATVQQQTHAVTALSAAKAAHPDYDEVVGPWQQRARLDPYAQQAIMQSPERYELCHFLATHPEEQHGLERLTGFDAILAIGALQERVRGTRAAPASAPNGAAPPPTLSPPPAPPPPPPPPPITPTRGRGTPPQRGYEGLSFLEFKKLRDKEEWEARR